MADHWGDLPVAEAFSALDKVLGLVPNEDGGVDLARVPRALISALPVPRVLTASSTWTRPDGCRAAIVLITGGGGGGGLGSPGGSGGGAGATSLAWLDVSEIETVSVTIGAGGASASAGGDTSFGSHATAKGGAAGGDEITPGRGALTGSTGLLVLAGGDGHPPPGVNSGGAGGASFWGGAPAGRHWTVASTGESARGYGCGGSGSPDTGGGGSAGGAGKSGVCVVIELY